MKTKLFRVISLFVALSGLVLLNACTKDDNADLIVGNWTLKSVNLDAVTYDGVDFVTYYVETLGASQAEAEQYYTEMEGMTTAMTGSINVKDDGTYSSTMGDETTSGTYELSSDGNTLTTDKGTSDEMVMTITELTEDNLKLTYTEEDTDDMNYDGVNETISMTMSMSFTK